MPRYPSALNKKNQIRTNVIQQLHCHYKTTLTLIKKVNISSLLEKTALFTGRQVAACSRGYGCALASLFDALTVLGLTDEECATPPSSLLFTSPLFSSLSLPPSQAKSARDIVLLVCFFWLFVYFIFFLHRGLLRKKDIAGALATNHQHSITASIPSPPQLCSSLSRPFPITSLPAKLSPLLSSCFLLLRTCHRSPRHPPPPTTPPPPCLPSSFCLFPLELTVPEGRGHLRTKWRISRQLCAHSLRWPSIIHCPPPQPTFTITTTLLPPSLLVPFSSAPAVCRRYLSVAFSH